MHAVILYGYLAAFAAIAFMACAVYRRAHDGSMTGRAELIEDIAEDTETIPAE